MSEICPINSPSDARDVAGTHVKNLSFVRQQKRFRFMHAYYSKAALKLRHQEVVNTSRVAPVGVPGISRSSVLAPRSSLNLSHGADPHSSSYM